MKATYALMLAIFCTGIGMYIVVALIPTMATDLNESVSSLALLVSAYALPAALLAPFFRPLSDRFGRRLVMVAGMSFFAVTVAGTAAAPSLGVLIVLRVLNGLGAAAVIAVTAFVAAFALLPRPQAVPREPEAAVAAADCVAECAPV